MSAVTLDLFFADLSSRPDRIVVLPQLPGSGVERLAGAVLDGASVGRRRVLPSPSPDAPPAALRGWCQDAWSALSDDDRSSLAIATGPAAAFLIPALGECAEPLAFVREPSSALQAAQPTVRLRKRVLEALEGDLNARFQVGVRGRSNPQSRALLAPWHDIAGLGVTVGPPEDADHWRALLFEDVLQRVTVARDAVAIARRLTGLLGMAPNRAVRVARSLTDASPSGAPTHTESRSAEPLRALSWLDMELYEHCSKVEAPA